MPLFNWFKKIKQCQVPAVRPPISYVPAGPRLSTVQTEPKLPDGDYLYVILPYFNYCGYDSRKRLFVEFIQRIQHLPNIRIVIAEAREVAAQYDLVLNLPLKIYLHVRTCTHHRIWIKENLINLAVEKLPATWKYMAWVDADLTFLNKNWAADTMQALNDFDVVQMFQSCANLGPGGETMKLDQSFFYMYEKGGKPYHKNAKYGFWHPGYAWACSRNAYEKMGGLVQFGILGSGDRHMALALIGKVDFSHPGNIHPNYAKHLLAYQKRCRGLRASYVPGTILHHFHGSLADRKYQERWTILTRHHYDPEEDLYITDHGVIQLTDKGMRMARDLSEYFQGRNEDGKRA